MAPWTNPLDEFWIEACSLEPKEDCNISLRSSLSRAQDRFNSCKESWGSEEWRRIFSALRLAGLIVTGMVSTAGFFLK